MQTESPASSVRVGFTFGSECYTTSTKGNPDQPYNLQHLCHNVLTGQILSKTQLILTGTRQEFLPGIPHNVGTL